jgi:FixJ family two-component response regulator
MTPLISLVDDDESIRESLPDLIRVFGYSVNAFASAEEFLTSESLDRTDCLILDIAMPGMSGPDLQQELKRLRRDIPIVFITAHVDETDRPRLIEAGAVDCLFKPFTEDEILGAVSAALLRSSSMNGYSQQEIKP